MLRSLSDDPANVIEAFAPSPACNLMKIARAQDAGLLAVELAEFGKENSANRDIDAHAQRVRAANDFEQTFLRELFGQHAILRKQSGMVKTDAVAEPAFDFRT